MDSFSRWHEDDDREFWGMVDEELGPKPEDPNSEAMKEYLEELRAFRRACTPLGRFNPLPIDHEFAQDGARFAIDEYNRTHEGEALEFKRVVNAELASLDLKLTLETMDGKFYYTKLIVWSCIPSGFKVCDFKPSYNLHLP